MTYPEKIVQIMLDENISFSQALSLDFFRNLSDPQSVLDICDYLEVCLGGDLDAVQTYMEIYTSEELDYVLEKKDKS